MAGLEIYLVIPLVTQRYDCLVPQREKMAQDRKKTDVKMEEKKGAKQRAEEQELNKGQERGEKNGGDNTGERREEHCQCK